VEEAKQTAQAVGEAASEKGKEALRMIRDLYVRNVQDELAKHEAHIQELQKKLEQTAAEARPELEKRIADLKGRVEAVRGTLQRLSAASDDAWNINGKVFYVAGGAISLAYDEDMGRSITKDGIWTLEELAAVLPAQLLLGAPSAAPSPERRES
jgi:16S rRNA C967 or C1407 C5-methylase (RsmB/RsmF family)